MEIKRYRWQRTLLGIIITLAAPLLQAASFVSVHSDYAIMYDAPSTRGGKLWLVRQGTPLKRVVALSTWTKVRDSDGTLSWIENSALSSRRMLMVTVPEAVVYASPKAGADRLFSLAQSVVVELSGKPVGGWVQIKHQAGSGYVKTSQVFGL